MQAFNSEQLMELKYCERCGGLWLRAKGHAGIYCGPCKLELAEYPAARMRTGKGGSRSGRSKTIHSTGCPIEQPTVNICFHGSVL
jgi:hypothetical protein